MKTKPLFILSFMFVCICTNILAQNTYVPDDNFEKALIDLGYDSGVLNDSVPTANINTVKVLDVSGKLISNLIGIEAFIELKELNCAGNQLIFKTLEPVFNLDHFNNITTFTYAPQDSIGVSNVIEKQTGEQISLAIDGYTRSENDLYQWYMNGEVLPGKIDTTLNINGLIPSHAGICYCEVKNTAIEGLSLFSRCVRLNISGAIGAGVPVTEYNALVDFYNNLEGNNWLKNDNWLDTTSHSVNDWFGITVENGHVTEINFDAYNNYNLNGSIPNSIRDLSKLKKIAIATDNISGILPDGLFDLEYLEELYIAECNISGTIPSKIGNMTNLKRIGLEANQIEGPIPPEIGNLANLEFLSFYENNLSGDILPSLGQLSNLFYLGLAFNELSGSIPASLGDINNLQWLLLDNNQLSGAIPKELANLTNIIKFTFEDNQIGISEPEAKSACLKSGTIENNRQIPDEFAKLIELDTFRLANNNFQFNDIEAIFSWDNFSSFNDFIYAPQDSIGITKTIQGEEGTTITISMDNYYPGPSDTYQWYKNNIALSSATSSSLTIDNLEESDEGIYHCVIANAVVQELKLISRTITLKVQTTVRADYSNLTEIKVFPNPAVNKVYINTGNKNVNLKVFNLAGILIIQRNNFQSQLFDISDYPKGTYIFQIEHEGQRVTTRKVIFK